MSGKIVALIGYIGLGTATGLAASLVTLTGIFTPLSLRYALCIAAPLGAVSTLCAYKALQI